MIAFGMTNAMAVTSSSTIPLDDGAVLPGNSFSLMTDKLYPFHDYTITCTIRNTNRSADEKSEISLWREHMTFNAYVDDELIEKGTGQVAHFNSKGATLKIDRANKGESIEIRNLDYTDTFSIEDCKAYLNN